MTLMNFMPNNTIPARRKNQSRLSTFKKKKGPAIPVPFSCRGEISTDYLTNHFLHAIIIDAKNPKKTAKGISFEPRLKEIIPMPIHIPAIAIPAHLLIVTALLDRIF